MRIVVVFGGEEASATALAKPEGLDLDEARKRHTNWYNAEYLPLVRSLIRGQVPPRYLSFEDWLKEREGCREATSDEVELYEEW